jgi:hypothetical protein
MLIFGLPCSRFAIKAGGSHVSPLQLRRRTNTRLASPSICQWNTYSIIPWNERLERTRPWAQRWPLLPARWRTRGSQIETAWPYSPVQVIPWIPPAITATLHKRRMVLGSLVACTG